MVKCSAYYVAMLNFLSPYRYFTTHNSANLPSISRKSTVRDMAIAADTIFIAQAFQLPETTYKQHTTAHTILKYCVSTNTSEYSNPIVICLLVPTNTDIFSFSYSTLRKDYLHFPLNSSMKLMVIIPKYTSSLEVNSKVTILRVASLYRYPLSQPLQTVHQES